MQHIQASTAATRTSVGLATQRQMALEHAHYGVVLRLCEHALKSADMCSLLTVIAFHDAKNA